MAGSSDFVIHNPTNANQQPDSVFADDALTTGGVGTDAILPSVWLNARWYEDSVGFACLAAALANKGYVISKDNPATLTAVLANILTNADIKAPLVSVAYSPTPTFPASTANGFDFVLAGNVTSSSFDVVPAIGTIITFVIINGAMPFTFVPPPTVNGWQPISAVANSVNIQQFIVRIDGTIWPLPDIQTIPVRGPLVSNGNGSYYKWSDGTIEAWGISSVSGGVGGNSGSSVIVFPNTGGDAFTTSPVVVASPNQSATGANPLTHNINGISTTGATIDFYSVVPEGGGGGRIPSGLTAYWRATGN